MAEQSLQLVIVGAHPDDPEITAGGLAAMYREHGTGTGAVRVTIDRDPVALL